MAERLRPKPAANPLSRAGIGPAVQATNERAALAAASPESPVSQHILDRLYDVVAQRRRERPADSYVVTLLDGGVDAIGAKIREEADELIEAASEEGASDHTVHEAADLLFHTWVLLGSLDVAPERVFAALEERFGTGGHAEKRARDAKGGSSAG